MAAVGMLQRAGESRRIQGRLQDYAEADLKRLFRMVEGLPPEEARDMLLELLPTLSAEYGDRAAAAGAAWFEQLREAEVGSFRAATLADHVPAAQVEGSVRFAAAHLFEGEPVLTEQYLAGQLKKWVAQPFRETIIHSTDEDPIGYGWQRVVRPNGCGFCRMLADRGGVYTRKSVWFASHANCNCGVVPSWDSSLPAVDVNAYEASKRMESVRRRAEDSSDPKKQAAAQRVLDNHRSNVRRWIADFEASGN